MADPKASLELVGADHEHTMALDGVCDGVAIGYRTLPVMELFKRMIDERAYEACEFSLSNYIGLKARGADWLNAIPVFPNRSFRHNTLYVRRDSDLTDPSQLRNRKLGVQEFSMTAAVWVRGFLLEQYGVDWRDIEWYCEAKHRRVAPPAGARVTEVSTDLESMLVAGELDAIMSFGPQDEKLPAGQRKLRRLLADPEQVEKAYYRDTGIYPINHCVVIRNDVIERIPRITEILFKAYARSKAAAYQRRIGATMIPWGKHYWTETMAFFGDDPLPYGLTETNRKVVGKLIGYLHEQKLISRAPAVDELFVKGSANYREYTNG